MSSEKNSQYPNLLDLIGNTPMIRLEKMCTNPNVTLLGKLECYNPTFSIKDRMVAYIFEQAIKANKISPKTTVVEASSGNTASSVAMLAARHDLKSIITVPDTTSIEKIQLAKLYGATVILCPHDASSESPDHYTNKAISIAETIPNSFILDQYNNPLNIEAHYNSTAQEILNQTHNNVDFIIGCASTGGTMSGIGRHVKASSPTTQIIIADSQASIFKSEFNNNQPNPHTIQPTIIEGAGKSYLPGCMEMQYFDEIVTVTDKQAIDTLYLVARQEGLCLGLSASLALFASLNLIEKEQFSIPTTIVTVLADSGLKYLSKLTDITDR